MEGLPEAFRSLSFRALALSLVVSTFFPGGVAPLSKAHCGYPQFLSTLFTRCISALPVLLLGDDGLGFVVEGLHHTVGERVLPGEMEVLVCVGCFTADLHHLGLLWFFL